MKLKSIQIKNYRSIEDVILEIQELDDKSFSYGLIGVNEAGKSSILKALALKDGLKNNRGQALPLQKDFRDRTNSITITYRYFLDKSELKLIKDITRAIAPEFDKFDSLHVNLITSFNFNNPSESSDTLEFEQLPNGNSLKDLVGSALLNFITSRSHKSVFWTAEERFLISQPINLEKFPSNPSEVSIPLTNSFSLAGMNNAQQIQERISFISESTERESLKDDLSRAVTNHINSVWKGHPIKITFDISDGLINFHIHDLKTNSKAKTADQRSDGFSQFVSFLLTISAQNKNKELRNTILLIDEPETHLHPRAQEDLMKEIISITQNLRNNVAFFATHSNYLIDKKDLSRNVNVVKKVDEQSTKERTEIKRFNTKNSTYASVTYEVFDIPSTDYHNELYAKLHEQYQDSDTADTKRALVSNFDAYFLNVEKKISKDKPWKGVPRSATLPTYIRNCIHHPDNGDSYTEEELRSSIEKLKAF